jgi:hypothetical protein
VRRRMRTPGANVVAWAALAVSIASLVASAAGSAGAARPAQGTAASTGIGIGTGSSKPRSGAKAGTVVRLGANGKIPVKDLPTVPNANNANKLGGQSPSALAPSCPPTTVDLGTWCLMASPYPLTNADVGLNNYFWASQACVHLGGYLPTAAQLIGAANRVKLESTINDSPLTATIDQDPTLGLKDQREMSATLVTITAGSDAAGSEGVSVGSTGNPNTGEPNPIPEPADPQPESLQYVTVYSNHQQGGFAGSEPVAQPENFRCAFNPTPGAQNQSTS